MRMIDYDKLRDDLMEATYHIGAPLSSMHGTCAKMIFTFMDYLVGDTTYEKMREVLLECQKMNR